MGLREVVGQLDDDDTLTVRTIRRLLEVHDGGGEVVRWVEGPEAAAVMDVSESTLRARAARWMRMQLAGEVPPVRVRKAGAKAGSPWLYDRQDVYGQARSTFVSPPDTTGPEVYEVDDREATIADYERLATENL